MYTGILNVEITEITEKVLELNPLVQKPLPIMGDVGTGNGVTDNKKTELSSPSKEKDAVKEIIDSILCWG
jgi:hypothetical protein